ncbi:MAG: ribonuclease P protein component [Acidimicrobiales bacterium]
MSDRATFGRLRRSGRRVRRGPVSVTWVEVDASEPTRVAYTVGRRVGTAVVRNTVRRRLRAAVASSADVLRPGPYLIGVGPEASRLPYRTLHTAVRDALIAVVRAPAPPERRSS